MVIWGGSIWNGNEFGQSFRDGARYNPATDHWSALTTNGAPHPSSRPATAWTGNEMIVWGGLDWGARTVGGNPPSAPTSARYDLAADSWKPLSRTNAPAYRDEHRWVWTEKELVIWGGKTSTDAGITTLNSGARYNAATDTWAALSLQNAPSPRVNPSAVWTGDAMLVFGGYPGGGINGLNSNHAWVPGQAIYLFQRQ
jgi:N-acetylneuraminic acid mutarotase